MKRTIAVVLAVTGVLLWGALQWLAPSARAGDGLLGTGVSPSRMTMIDDDEADCFEATPDGMSLVGVTDEGGNVNLEVLVLLDGVDQAAAVALFTEAQRSYTPLGITLRPTFQVASFPDDDARRMLDHARLLLGGRRPAGSDVVHVLTAKNIHADGNKAVAGLAACIGGVKDPVHAFSVAETNFSNGIGLGPVSLARHMAARVTGHEIGHLLGAHHHYANCVEGGRNTVATLEASTCTLMFNVADFLVTNFSTLNGTVVRAHAVDYARP